MEETPVQQCSVCGISKPLTTEFYGVNADSKTGFRNRCKTCFNDGRKKKKSPEEKRLQMHSKIIAEAKRRLAHPETLTPGELSKLEVIVRLENERLEKLQEKVAEQRKAETAAKFAQTANPSLARVQAQFGSPLFIPSAERRAVLEQSQAVLATLTGPADGPARDYVQSSIAELTEMLANAAARESFVAQHEQETANGSACQAAADAIHDKFAGLFSEGVSTIERDKLKTLFQIVRTEAQQQHKTIKPDEMTATGANRKKVSSRILEELAAIASRLGKAGTEVGPHQSLENVQSLELGTVVGGMQMRAYVRKLTAQLEEARATMTPKEYEAKFLNLPVAPKEETVVWRIPIANGKYQNYWPDGRLVLPNEIVKDMRLNCWCLAPSPVGAQIDDEDKPAGKMELVQEDDGSWKWIPEGSRTYTQQVDGTWLRDAGGESPWSTPEPVTFRVAPAQPDAEHCEFRSGHWWTQSECEKAEHGPDLKEPPVILPPLERGKADSIATEVITAEKLAKMNGPAESPWVRHERKQRQEKEREQALLRGTFVWDKNQATTN